MLLSVYFISRSKVTLFSQSNSDYLFSAITMAFCNFFVLNNSADRTNELPLMTNIQRIGIQPPSKPPRIGPAIVASWAADWFKLKALPGTLVRGLHNLALMDGNTAAKSSP